MSSPFTDADRAFLRGILNNPAELTGWLVYADWLDEKGQTERAEYIRLQVRLGRLGADDPDRPPVTARLHELKVTIHPLWAAVFDRPVVENCAPEFAFECPKQWEKLKVTEEADQRYCESCERRVYYCHNIYEAQSHAWQGHCVAVSLTQDRYPGDLLDGRLMVMGMLRDDTGLSPPPPRRRPWWKFW